MIGVSAMACSNHSADHRTERVPPCSKVSPTSTEARQSASTGRSCLMPLALFLENAIDKVLGNLGSSGSEAGIILGHRIVRACHWGGCTIQGGSSAHTSSRDTPHRTYWLATSRRARCQ